MAASLETSMSRLGDSIEFFQLKCELGELTSREKFQIKAEFTNAFHAIVAQEFSRAYGFINRANALMN